MGNATDLQRVFKMPFASVYPLYVQKAEKKGRKKREVDEVICWLTGYDARTLAEQIKRKKDLESFFSEAPGLHPTQARSRESSAGFASRRSRIR